MHCCLSLSVSSFTSLDELFRQKQTLIPTPSSLPVRVHTQSYAVVHPTPGICINVDTSVSSISLRGLCLASPSFFHERPITAVVAKFDDPSTLNQDLERLGWFLATHPGAATVEAVILDFANCKLPARECTGLPKFLHIFSTKRKSAKCISMTLLGGADWDTFVDKIHYAPSRRYYFSSSTIQNLFAIASRAVGLRSTLKAKSSSSATGGLVMLNLDTYFINHLDKHSSWAITLLAQHSTSLRSFSIAKWSMAWGHILAHATLPSLEELYFCSCGITLECLTEFLSRHRSVRVLSASEPWSLFKASWSPPPFFLPNLTTLVTWTSVFGRMMRPNFGSKPLPNLRDVTFWLYMDGLNPLIQHMLWDHGVASLNDYVIGRLHTLKFGLGLHIAVPNTNWVKDSYEGDAPRNHAFICNELKFIQVHLPEFYNTQESQDVHLHFSGWLRLFPRIESVEVWLHPMSAQDAEEWKEAARLARVINPSLQSFCVEGVQLLQ